METVTEKLGKLVRAILWCAVSCLIVGVVLSNLEDNQLFVQLYWISVLGTLVFSIVSIVLGRLAYWQNARGPWSAAGKAAARRGIELGIVGIILMIFLSAFMPIRERSISARDEIYTIWAARCFVPV